MIAIDTNIFVYLYDTDEPDKQKIAKQLLDDLALSIEPYLIMWQVAGELLNVFRKWVNEGKFSASKVEAFYSAFLKINTITIPNIQVIFRSIDLYSRYSLSHWDSLLVAACLEAGVTTLYSEDMSHMARYDSIQVINPFKLPSAN